VTTRRLVAAPYERRASASASVQTPVMREEPKKVQLE